MSIDPSPYHTRLEIQENVLHQWECLQDSAIIKSALESARDPMLGSHPDTIARAWRWLADDMADLYREHPAQASLCYDHILGILEGLEHGRIDHQGYAKQGIAVLPNAQATVPADDGEDMTVARAWRLIGEMEPCALRALRDRIQEDLDEDARFAQAERELTRAENGGRDA